MAQRVNRGLRGTPMAGLGFELEAAGWRYHVSPALMAAIEGRAGAELKQAIFDGATSAANGHRPSLRQIGAGRLLRQTYRGIMTTPRRMGWGPTAGSFVRRIFGTR